MRNKVFIWVIGFAAIFLYHEEINAYSQGFHKKITERVIDLNTQKLNIYLKTIGLTKGVTEAVINKEARKYIEDGSYNEDDNWTVQNNWLLSHFYEPISNTSGVGSIPPSDYDWTNAYNNHYSWKEARNSLYYGLIFKTKYERDISLAIAFEAIGHIIHLVEDMAVPSHTRGDLHASVPVVDKTVGRDMYEDYTKKMGKVDYTSFSFPYWNVSISTGAPKQFWDLDSYNGTTPYYTGYIGLAEYTNANFFSKDTIFKNFPHPAKENTTAKLVEQTARDGKTDKTWYIQGYTSERLAAYSYMLKYMIPILPGINIPVMGWLYNLDNYVHEDYASQLIPRAVGYSAGLLDYFFRGTIGIERDQNAPDELVVMNLSAEQMNGSFGLYYDDATDYRRSVGSWGLDIPAYSPKYAPLSYCTLKDLKPEPKQKGIYILTFQGTMGNEAGAVAGNANIDLLASSCGTALTITGPDTIAQDTSTQLEVSGCTGCADDVTWTASGTGASIDKTGLLTVDKTACGGTLTITAKCPDCKTEISKTITIPDLITISGPDAGKCYTTTGAEPYQWSITKGSIDEKGCVTTTGECGTATLTVTDTNGCTGTKEVNLSAENCSALTIINENGAPATDTILRGGSIDYKTTGDCCGEVLWSVTPETGGTTISPAGVLRAGATSCGSLFVTATCVECGTSATQYVKVTNAGKWVLESTEAYCSFQGAANTCNLISGSTLRHTFYFTNQQHCPTECSSSAFGCPLIYDCTSFIENIGCTSQSVWCQYKTKTHIYKWQCP